MQKKAITLLASIALVLASCSNPPSAGVLPYAKHNGIVYFLLGEERYRPGQWSDFGGRAEGNETPLQTARREFLEETGGQLTGWALTADTPIIINEVKNYHMHLVQVDFVDPKTLSPTDEKVDFVWVARDDVLKKGPIRAKFGSDRTKAGAIITLYAPFAQSLTTNPVRSAN